VSLSISPSISPSLSPSPSISPSPSPSPSPSILVSPSFNLPYISVSSSKRRYAKPSKQLKRKPLSIDILPTADLLSIHITESLTGRRARHPAKTKKKKLEFFTGIKTGRQFYKTYEMEMGLFSKKAKGGGFSYF